MSFDLPALPAGWSYIPLETCVQPKSITYGVVQPGTAVEDGVPIIRVNNFLETRLDLSELMRISPDVEAKYGRTRLAGGEVLLTLVGSVGQVAVVPREALGFNVARAVGVIHPLPHVSAEWIAICLRSPLSQHLLGSRANTTVQTTINLKDVRALPIPMPPVKERQRICDLIMALDNRISILRETNATLEAIAQTLFKSWFVDFDPVRAKQQGLTPEGMEEEISALFPDGFEETELGAIPKGWHVATLGELASTTIGGLWGEDSQEEQGLVPAISLRGVDLEHLRSQGFSTQAPVRWVKPTAMEKRRLQDSQVLVAASGAGPCGRPLWAGAGFESLYGIPVIFSNFVKRFDCGTSARAIYVDRVLAEMRNTREIWNFINGTSVPNLDDKLLLSTKKIVVPPADILSVYEGVARTIYRKLYDQKAQTLAALRDTLLPRLISGQLRLPAGNEVEPETILEEFA